VSDRYALIGDIHGVLPPVIDIVERAQEVADSIVFLGDYVNRGPQSRQVIDFLIDLRERLSGRVHFLGGHHDLAFLNAVADDRIDVFLRMGGAATLNSYPRADAHGERLLLRQRVPASHVSFLRDLAPAFNADGLIAMHDQSDAPSTSVRRFGVFGHRPQPSTEPKISNDFALIDTGCGTLPGGKLTCFLWPDRTWFQAS